MDELDVVVVGGGPGGAAAAIACAQAGLKVALLEQARFPRPHPGETLHPGVEPLLRTLGVWEAVVQANFLRHAGHAVAWFAEQRFEAFGADAAGPWLGFQAWRAEFDAILLRHAAAVGVQVLQPARALRPLVILGRVSGVVTAQGAIATRFTIDATGSTGWLARHLPLRVESLTPRRIAHYGYGVGECPARDEYPLIVAEATGWTWLARVRPQLYQWTRLRFTDVCCDKDWRPTAFRELKPWDTVKAADVTWRRVIAPAGPGYFIVGDAAAVLDPAASHGVLRALMSGMMVGHLIAQAMAGQQTQGELTGILHYQQWLQNWVLQDVERLRALYAPFQLETLDC